MRVQQRVSVYTWLSFWPTRLGYPQGQKHERHLIVKSLHQFLKNQKRTLETIMLTLFLGSLLLCGIYLFLSQLAQYGW